MEDHDQRFKKLVREFFRELFLLFFPQWAGQFDFAQVVWLDKEVFTDAPRGESRAMDLVAKLPTRKGPSVKGKKNWLALIHIEVEARDSVAPLRRRMYEYYHELRHNHSLQVLPIALYQRGVTMALALKFTKNPSSATCSCTSSTPTSAFQHSTG